MEALGINLGYIFVQIFNFAILFLVLRAWVYEPIINMLDNRRKSVEKGLESFFPVRGQDTIGFLRRYLPHEDVAPANLTAMRL